MRRWFVLGCVVLGCASAPVLAFQAGAEQKKTDVVGMVASCKGSLADFKILRAGEKKERSVKVLMRLSDGDQISARAGSGVLTISYTDGTTEEITTAQAGSGFLTILSENGTSKDIRKEKSPYSLKARGNKVGFFDKLKAFFKWTDESQIAPVAATGSRGMDQGKPLRWTLPDLSFGGARVVHGERRLGVTWKGGKGRYHVMVKAPDGRTLLDEQTEDMEVLSIKPLKLSSGRHEVLVIDDEKKQLKGSFTVVEPSALPVTEAAPVWFHKGPARAFRARELSNKDKRRWCYEAYLSLIGVEEDFGVDGKDSWATRLRREICF